LSNTLCYQSLQFIQNVLSKTQNPISMSELLYRIALTKIPKVGAIITKNLISHCGSAENVFKTPKKDLVCVPNVGAGIAENIIKQDVLRWAEKEMLFIEKNDVKVLCYTDKEYPQRLKTEYDAPALLYYKGNADLNHGRNIGIVGTRKPSAYGIRMCEEIAEGLKAYNPLIISGLAHGIDITAHRRCLASDIPTVGVMGHGLQRMYPHEHREIAQLMIENGGLLTEYPSDQDPDREHFPMRNRIIVGLSDVLIVVESGLGGGSMISANVAIDYSRELCAVPGRAGDKNAAGCNSLIRRHKATLVETADDVATVMLWKDLDEKKVIQSQLFVQLTDNQQLVINFLKQSEGGVTIDALAYQTQLSQSNIAALLLELEFKGVVRALAGKRFTTV
jgi:DNA processing protein